MKFRQVNFFCLLMAGSRAFLPDRYGGSCDERVYESTNAPTGDEQELIQQPWPQRSEFHIQEYDLSDLPRSDATAG